MRFAGPDSVLKRVAFGVSHSGQLSILGMSMRYDDIRI